MAIMMGKVTAMSSGVEFLKKMTPSVELHKLIDHLEKSGVEFTTHFYHFVSKLPNDGGSIKTVLPVGTNTLADAHSKKKGYTPEMALAESGLRKALYEIGVHVMKGEQHAQQFIFGKQVDAEFLENWYKVIPTAGLPPPTQPMQFVKPKPVTKTGLKPGSFLDMPGEDSESNVKVQKKPMVTFPATGSVLPLAQATKTGQRVFGSSQGSIYTCVGISQNGMRLAVRYADAMLSFRVEGGLNGATMSLLQQHGFEVKGNYASMHLGCASENHAWRAIGSVLFGTGINYQDKLANLQEVFS